MTAFILFAMVLWLAYGNGANDNFKGVATLYGSGTATFRQALTWATVSTFAGSLVSILLAERLLAVFSGKGLLPEALLGEPTTLIAIGGAAALTIMLATLLGMPTSTTHALTGALLGIALVTSGSNVPWASFLRLFAVPLLVSPLLAILITVTVYPVLRWFRLRADINPDTCACVDDSPAGASIGDGAAVVACASVPAVRLGTVKECGSGDDGAIQGINAQTVVDTLHYLSAGAVCFSRAVNDTPKIAALLLVLGHLDKYIALGCVALAMALGGMLQSRKIAETMGKRITTLNSGQGLCANLVTALLVLFASRLGVPVSTTHVSCGAIFGIGVVERNAQWKTITAVLATWITTLPLAALVGAMLYGVLSADAVAPL